MKQLASNQSWRADAWQYDPSSNRLFSLNALTEGVVDVQLSSSQQGKTAAQVASAVYQVCMECYTVMP